MNEELDSARHRPLVGALLGAGLLAVLIIGLARLPGDGAPLPQIARYALLTAMPVWKTTEPVNEIVYGTRGWDTFGETFLLFAAVVSVALLTRGREPRTEYVGEAEAGAEEQAEFDPMAAAHDATESQAREAEREEEQEGEQAPQGRLMNPDFLRLGTRGPDDTEAMTVIVRVASRTAAVVLAVAAIYLCAWGYSPGGGFPAGAALTGVVVLIYAALGFSAIRRVVRPVIIESAEIAGAMAIVLIGLLGLIRKGSYLANWVPLAPLQTIRSGGNIQPFSVSELVEVATGLVLAIFALLGMRHEWTPDEGDQT